MSVGDWLKGLREAKSVSGVAALRREVWHVNVNLGKVYKNSNH